MNKIVVVPTAKFIPLELALDFGQIPSGLIPLNAKPAIHYIAQRWVERGYKVIAAAHEGIELLHSYLQGHPELGAETVDVGPTCSLAETILNALNSLKEDPGHLVVNYADTLVDDPLPEDDFLCVQKRKDLFRWTALETDEAGRISKVIEKNRLKPRAEEMFVVVGVWGVTKPGAFRLALEARLAEGNTGADPLHDTLAQYLNARDDAAKHLVEVNDWLDFGHVDTYYRTQKSVFLGKRYFNSMKVDLQRGVVRKESRNEAKLREEIKWYLGLPSGLRHLTPRVFSWSLEQGSTFAEMEYYGYPALNDVYLFGNWDAGIWSQVLAAIEYAVDQMKGMRDEHLGSETRRAAMLEMYEGKIRERLSSIQDDTRFHELRRPALRINGEWCPGLTEALEVLPNLLRSMGVYRDQAFTIIHGDLCLSNILYDRRSGFVRLIDPRGHFGGIRMFGDPRYDLAKLSHSLEGDYDFLVNGLFDVEETEGGFDLVVRKSAEQRKLAELFHAWLVQLSNGDYGQVKLLEATLFLSMIPLHADRPRSQFAFLLQALSLIGEIARRNAPEAVVRVEEGQSKK